MTSGLEYISVVQNVVTFKVARLPQTVILILALALGLTAPLVQTNSRVASAASCVASTGPGIPAPQNLPVGIPGFHASWYGQSGYPTLCPGDRSTATVAYYNSGSRGWVQGKLGEVAYLGTWGPEPGQDGVTPLGGDGTNGSPSTGWPRFNRLAVQPAAYVAPGQVSWFQFTIQAPSAPGYYKLYLRPLVEGAQWLEDYGVFWLITVLNPDGTLPGATPVTPPLPSTSSLEGSWSLSKSKLSCYAGSLYAPGGESNWGGVLLSRLVIGSDGHYQYGPERTAFGVQTGTASSESISDSDWSRWNTQPYGPTRRIKLTGWGGGIGFADGPIEENTTNITSLWVIYRYQPSQVSEAYGCAGTVQLQFVRAAATPLPTPTLTPAPAPVGPRLTSIWAFGPGTVSILFNNFMNVTTDTPTNTDTILHAENYKFTNTAGAPNPIVVSVTSGDSAATLRLNSSTWLWTPGVTYTLTVRNVKDYLGAVIDPAGATSTWTGRCGVSWGAAPCP